MAVIGEAVVVLRPDVTGFGRAAKTGIDKELLGYDLLGSVGTDAAKTAGVVETEMGKAGRSVGDAFDSSRGKVSSFFGFVGSQAAGFGLPFAGGISAVGHHIDEATTKGQKLNQTMSTLGGTFLGVGLVGAAAVAGESIHLAMGLQTADAQIAAHENISVNAANNIGKAFLSTAGTVPFSANQLASSFAPVSGELDQIAGHSLTAAQTLHFMAATGDLAEATNANLGSTTATVGKIMQAFQVPLSGTVQLTNELFNTSRVTGVGVDQLGSVIDRLKSRLGIAAPTVGDLGSLLVDLNEHGVQGSRGLLVVNTAITTLLNSVPKVDAATAKAANTLESKLTTASSAATKATDALSAAQAAGAQKVADAQRNLTDVQDRIAASATAAAPTTAQQIELQNAQIAVQKAQQDEATKTAAAQTKLGDATSKVSALQATAGTSTNAQVKAMQQLGLQVYNTNGTFVGMRSIIDQLSPRLHQMTQEQQLATLSQIFGSAASKSLLDTVLAGPAAYDKAAKAVNDSSTAHAGAEKQAQTLKREADVLGATLVDEGDKIGTALIPKLEDLAKWSAEDVRWLGKHKDVLYALGILAGGFVAVSIGTYAVNTMIKWGKSVGDAGKAVGGLASTVLEKLGIIDRKSDESSSKQQTDADKFSTAGKEMSDSVQSAAEQIVTALQEVADKLDTLVASMQGTSDKVDGSMMTISGSAGRMAEQTQLSFADVDSSFATMATETQVNGDRIIATYGEMGLAAERYAATSSAANAEAGAASALGGPRQMTFPGLGGAQNGLTDLRAAEPGLLEAEAPAAGGLLSRIPGIGGLLGGGGGAAGGLAAGAGVAGVGMIGVQLYNSLAEKKVGHLIGTNAASALGDAGTGAAIGAGIGTVVPGIGTALGAGVGAAAGLAFAERKPLEEGAKKAAEILTHGIGGKTGITGDIMHAAINASPIGIVGGLFGGLFGGGPAKPQLTETQKNTQHSQALVSKMEVLNQLQRQAYIAVATTGANSTASKAALASLYATESKWLPHIGKDETLGKVDRTLFITTLAVNALKDKQAKLAQDGTVAQTTKTLTELHATLKSQQHAGASEQTLKLTQSEITKAQQHLDALRSLSGHISRDETTIKKADETKASIEKVNHSMDQLRQEIKTNPPPKQHATGTLRLQKAR